MTTGSAPERWSPSDLRGRIAVLTGASRGVGRGIAEVLGECGATVYLTGRTPATLETAAESVTERGGEGIAVRCDHRNDHEVERLFKRIEHDHRQLDILVSNAVGWGDAEGDGNQSARAPIWRKPVEWWDANFQVGVRSHFVACRYATPLMLDRKSLIVFTNEWAQRSTQHVDVVLDGRAHAVARMARVLGNQLRPRRVATAVVVPGFPRTEDIVAAFEAGSSYFEGWTRDDFHTRTESLYFAGRGVAALVGDPAILRRTGRAFRAHEIAEIYGFTDVDGRIPLPVA